MRVMLLAAGMGERLRPLTDRIPKPAVPVLGRPLVVQIIRWLSQTDPERLVMNLHHRPEVLVQLLGDGTDFGLPAIRYSREDVILGTAGGIRHALPLLDGSGPLLVSNCDALSDIDLRAAIESHSRSGLPATLVLAAHRAPYSEVLIDEDGRVISLAGEPRAEPERVRGRYLFTGCQILEDEVLERIPREGPSDIVRSVHWQLAAEGRLGAFIHDGFWWEFGSPELYLEGSLLMIDESVRRRRRISEHDPVREIDQAMGAIGAGAKYDPRASLVGRVALGFASRVSESCRIEDSIVMPEAWIAPGCRLRRSIVGSGVELPTGTEVDGQLVCADTDRDTEAGSVPQRSITQRDGLLFCPLMASVN